ncbi:MAG: Hsp70 family protein [Candidatus Magnetoovum sp. WYHC-5]|nr:Hsp70 family protein [Candidatus Magnetoovum sp. WYHC-5]
MKEIICGIDLGTTNSCISYLKDGKPVVVSVEGTSAIMPSVVSYDEKTKQIIVGKEALNRLAAFPHHTVRSIKRLMGKDTKVHLGKQVYSPEEVSSFILQSLAEKAANITGALIKKAVITVPAYFNDAQRRATIAAGELAGLEVLRIINEPTAASLVYDYVSKKEQLSTPYILVYDLGGGTFDVSILEIKGEIKEVLASCGDTALGGDDFDERLVDLFLRNIKEKTGLDFTTDNRVLHVRLKDIAERTKISLSDNPYIVVKEASILTHNGEPINLDIEVTRKEYEEMIADLVNKTVEKVKEALTEAHLTSRDIAEVLLVGGSTRTPMVQEVLAGMFDIPMYHSVDPDLCVSLGAAVQSGLITGEPLGHILLDVTAHSLGVKTADNFDYVTGDADYFSVIIKRNTKVPVRRAELYFTMVNEQEAVKVEVYQGESYSCKENTLIGDFIFKLQPSPTGSPIVTEFSYDKEGIVHVLVEQKGYNNHKEVTLDVRTRKVKDKEISTDDQRILNYIVEKYRQMLNKDGLSEGVKNDLLAIGQEYEEALRTGKPDDIIDDLEARLLEKIEEAEEEFE